MRRLLVGYKAADLSAADFAGGETTVHVLDLYHAHALERVFPGARVVCAAELPPGPWDLIRFRTGPKLMSGELALDLLQAIHQLEPRRFELDYVGRERDRNELLDKIRKDAGRVRSFRAVWPASVQGAPPLEFVSYPGCFCHRRLDAGGLALAEVVSRELVAEPAAASVSLLDMGCGSGLVGLLVAHRRRAAGLETRLMMLDSHVRAVAAARENAARFGLAAEVVLADDGLESRPERGTFDVFAGNPPYYSDYRIAEVFFRTAQLGLRPGGLAFAVVKDAACLKPVMERFFPAVTVLPRRGYAVLRAVAGGAAR